jgi:hypothetical protein
MMPNVRHKTVPIMLRTGDEEPSKYRIRANFNPPVSAAPPDCDHDQTVGTRAQLFYFCLRSARMT